jgi:hypothetical protein
MFLDIDNSLNTRQAATGAQIVVVGADLRRGPVGNAGGVAYCTLFIAHSGDITLITADGDEISMPGIPAGTHLPLQVRTVTAWSGDEALIALY